MSSEDVALWLRFQIAAGRLSRTSDLANRAHLSARLGVSPETIAQAYDLISDPEDPSADLRQSDAGGNGYRAFAKLLDKIASISARPF
ncbi:MAG: hypothetical protein ACR2PO_19450 [Methyloligellaceae bacterium]